MEPVSPMENRAQAAPPSAPSPTPAAGATSAASSASTPTVDLPLADATQPPSQAGAAYGDRPDVVALADAIAARNHLDAAWVRSLLGQARYQASAAQLIMPAPAGAPKNWAAYRSRFVEPRHIQAGVDFWRSQAHWLELAQREYGVAPQIIVGLIGVETYYGRIMGNYRLLDALATLSFDFPKGRSDRSGFFRQELEQWVVLVHELGAQASDYTGSYAGAIGLPQFMPSSWRQYAVDFDGDGAIDLIHDSADAIGSVANFLARHGWQRDLPTHFQVQTPQDRSALAALMAPDITPTFSAKNMLELGASFPASGAQFDGPLALVALPNGFQSTSYVAGTQNFYAITRYNHSAMYAMAVIELGEAIEKQKSSLDDRQLSVNGPAAGQ